jgi:hypothetical protein
VSVVDKELIPIPEADPLRNYVDRKGRVVEDLHPMIPPLTPIRIEQPKVGCSCAILIAVRSYTHFLSLTYAPLFSSWARTVADKWQGPSFRVEGYHVQWDKWSFRVGFTPKEGLVLHTVSLFDPDKNRMRCAGLPRLLLSRRMAASFDTLSLFSASFLVPFGDTVFSHHLQASGASPEYCGDGGAVRGPGRPALPQERL